MYAITWLLQDANGDPKALELKNQLLEISDYDLAELIKIARKYPDSPSDLTKCATVNSAFQLSPQRIAALKSSETFGYVAFEKQIQMLRDDVSLINEARTNVAFGVNAHTVALTLEIHIARAEELYG